MYCSIAPKERPKVFPSTQQAHGSSSISLSTPLWKGIYSSAGDILCSLFNFCDSQNEGSSDYFPSSNYEEFSSSAKLPRFVLYRPLQAKLKLLQGQELSVLKQKYFSKFYFYKIKKILHYTFPTNYISVSKNYMPCILKATKPMQYFILDFAEK